MEENIHIGFLKKIWYSIARPSKYQDLNKLGLWKAIKYFFLITISLALIIAIIETCITRNKAKEALSCLEEKLPDMKFKQNILQLENEDTIYLNDDKIIDFFRIPIVINTTLTKEEAIGQFKDLAKNNNIVAVFLKEDYLLISRQYNEESQEGIVSQKYSEISSKYIKDENYEYGKQDLLEYLGRKASIAYFVSYYLITCFLRLIAIFFIYIVLATTGLWLVTKAFAVKWTYKESLINVIYASTLPMLVYIMYLIISYFANFSSNIIDIICIAIMFVYLYILLFRQIRQLKKK